MEEEIWPPRPTGQPEPVITPGVSVVDQRLGAVALCLALAGTLLFLVVIVASSPTQRHFTQTAAFVSIMANCLLACFVLDALAVLTGFLSRRSLFGKIAMVLPLAAILVLSIVILLAPRLLRV